ncbi:putative short-chain dehydrogenase [Rhizodiscina lignyota]|uniref:Short-chain dehydrogenase n=1 Tax=Rhizodiscina lignyota TaxID=1504668 RepID=A0A9P4M8V3_9PEZI|nr:putative short-chain dehydrogenase [Rhizodiscina lignyota]
MSDAFNPYKELYAKPNGPGDSRPTALQIIRDNDRVNSWADKVVLITGATNGIGIETAKAMHATGAHVFITARDPARAKTVVEDILKVSESKGKLEVIEMHMESSTSVRDAAREFLSKSKKLNILINNAEAGIMATPESKSDDGFELQFAVNHLAHFILATLLLPALLTSSAPDFNSRVVFVSSSSHRYSSIHWDNVNLEGEYDPYIAYGQSKTAEVWTSNYVDRVYGPRGVHSLSVHPGGIFTNLQKHAGEEQMAQWKADPNVVPSMLSPEQGAATTVWAATAKVWEGKGGKYLANCMIAPPATNLDSALDPGVGPDAYNKEGEDRLWALSSKMAGVSAP